MNPTATPSEAELQAYIDGYLSPERHAQVAAYLEDHPETAARVHAYQEQNRMLHGLFDHVLNEPLPENLSVLTRATAPRRTFRYAALLAWFLVGGIVGYLMRGAVTRPQVVAEPLAERAAIAHVVYSAELLHPVEVAADQETHLVHWLSKRLGHRLHVPDLSKFGYQLVGGRLLPGDSRGVAAQFMYQSAHGARLTLYVSVRDKGSAQTAFRVEKQDGQQVMYWVDDDLGFALVGEKDRKRLLEMARATYQAMSY